MFMRFIPVALALILTSCAHDTECLGAGDDCVEPDSSVDGGPTDSGGDDGGMMDGTVGVDSGSVDSGRMDGSFDSARPDTGAPDTGSMDSATSDTGARDTGTIDTGTPDTGTPDTGPPDPCPGVCTAGQVQVSSCSGTTCESRSRTCRSDCTWGSYGACGDDDDRCSSPAGSCISDYCWGWEHRQESTWSCLDMNTDYAPGGGELGTLETRVYGRPGAVWTKENRQLSCGGAWADSETHTIGGSGVFSSTFAYGTSPCDLSSLGRWESRVRIHDTDSSTFFIGGTPETTYYNSSCSSDRRTCSAARSFCPP